MGKHSKEDKNSSKKSKKHKKEKKSSKESKHSKDKKSSRKDHKSHKEKESHTQDASISLVSSHPNRKSITIDDYFLLNEHFRVWLVLIRKLSFESLTSDESHNLFKNEFVSIYNRNGLPEMFYKDEIPVEMRDAALKTKHKWNFKVSKDDAEKISIVADDVDFKTRHVTEGAWNHMHKPSSSSSSNNNRPNTSSSNQNSSSNQIKPTRDDALLQRDNMKDDFKRKQHETKKEYRNYSSDVLEEFSSSTSGGGARSNKLDQMDRQKASIQSSHAIAKEKEEDRDGLNMDEQFIMGGGDDFESTKARLNRNKDFRNQQKSEHIKELMEKEKLKTANFMSQLGVDLTKGPIKIQPRI